MACMAVPRISVHIYMAVINPSSRKGLSGMIAGFIDRHWAEHHYRRWYREHHEAGEQPAGDVEQPLGDTGAESPPSTTPAAG